MTTFRRILNKRYIKYPLLFFLFLSIHGTLATWHRDFQLWLDHNRLERRQSQWESLSISHYQIEMDVLFYSEESSSLGEACQQTVEILNGQVVNQATCTSNLATVDDLFQLVDEFTSEAQCGLNGCVCDGVYEFEVGYNESLGFPESVNIQLIDYDWWMYFPDVIWGFPLWRVCLLLGGGRRDVSIQITDLTTLD